MDDCLPGKIVWAEAALPGTKPISHYFNEIDGIQLDLTRTQFAAGAVIPIGVDKTKGFKTTREYVLSFEKTRERYLLLKKRVDQLMEKDDDDTPMMGSMRYMGERLREEEGINWGSMLRKRKKV